MYVCMLAGAGDRPKLSLLVKTLVLPSRSYNLARYFPKFSYQAQVLTHVLGATALIGLVCPQFWPLHVLMGATALPSLASSLL